MCRRSPEGWIVSRVIGDSIFINQRLLEDKLVLRSGDIIRLSAIGPDVQFTLQSGGLAVKSLASRFLPAQTASSATPQIAGPVRPDAAPRAPGAPALNAPSPVAPRRPGSPAETRPAPAAPSPPRRDTAPVTVAAVAPAPPKPVGAPSAPRPAAASVAANVMGSTATSANANGNWLDPKSWSKNQKNTAIAVIGGIFVIILVILIPTSPSKPSANSEKPKETVEQTEKIDATPKEAENKDSNNDAQQAREDGTASPIENESSDSVAKESATAESSN